MPKHPAHNRQTSCVHKLTNIFAFCNNFSLSNSKFNKKLNLISAKSWQVNEIIIVQDTYTHKYKATNCCHNFVVFKSFKFLRVLESFLI